MFTNYHIRFRDEIYKKIKQIAIVNNRSFNKQLEFISELYIKDYEKINGKIEIPDEETKNKT